MKKLFISAVLLLSCLYTQAQGLIITSTVTLTLGDTASLVYVQMQPRLQNMVDGTIVLDLFFYKSKADYDAGYQRVFFYSGGEVLNQLTITVNNMDVIKPTGVTKASDVNTWFYAKLMSELHIQKGLNSIQI